MYKIQVNLCQKLFFLQNMGRTCCVQKLFWMSETMSVHNMFSSGLSLKFSFIEHVTMNNLLSYYGLVDAKMTASDKDLPVLLSICQIVFIDEMFEQRLQIMMIERVSVEHSLVVCKIYHYAVNCRQRVHTAYSSERVW